MDYASGTELVKYQWDVVHDPQNKLFNWSQDEEEGQKTENISGKFTDELLQSIKEANYSNNNLMNVKWTPMASYYSTVVEISGVKMKLGVNCNGTDITKIKPLILDTDVKINSDPTMKDVVIWIINQFGDFFDVKDYLGAHKVRTFRFHEPNSSHNISLVFEEKYTNIIGSYLFGTKWEFKHLKQDRSFVLHIHSPWFSNKFNEANGNLIEQRRLMYLALGQSTEDADEEVLKQFNYIAKLTANINAQKPGLTVYTYKRNEANNTFEPNPVPLQYDEYNLEWPDVNYPVDIKLWDGNDKPALGENFYSEYQLRKGKYTDVSFGASMVVPGGSGLLKDYIKGFGYCEFAYLNHLGKAISVDAGLEFSTGIVEGKYIKTSGIPNPVSFSGPGSNKTYSASDFKVPVGPTLSYWIGYDNEGTPTWKGSSVGIKSELSRSLFKKLNLPGEYTETKVYTELIYPLLDKKSETYTKLNNDNIYNGKK